MTVTPRTARLVDALYTQYAGWQAARHDGDSETCAAAHNEMKELLRQLERTLPLTCPYCDTEMGEPDVGYDEEGYSVATHECPRCGAYVEVKHIPGDFVWGEEGGTCRVCGIPLPPTTPKEYGDSCAGCAEALRRNYV